MTRSWGCLAWPILYILLAKAAIVCSTRVDRRTFALSLSGLVAVVNTTGYVQNGKGVEEKFDSFRSTIALKASQVLTLWRFYSL
jgi:hypothetical protein